MITCRHYCRLSFDFPLIERNDNEVDSIKSLPEVDVKTEETISSSANIEKEGFAEELYYCGFCDSTQPSVAVRWCLFCQIMICAFGLCSAPFDTNLASSVYTLQCGNSRYFFIISPADCRLFKVTYDHVIGNFSMCAGK